MPGTPPSTHGPVRAVPCPHCSKPNDFSELMEHLIVADGVGEGNENGQRVTCDYCDQAMVVVAVRTTTLVQVRKP